MSESYIALCQLSAGQRGVVEKMTISGQMRRRLFDLGLIPGTMVECLQIAPAGSPIAYQIRGAAIALRKRDAEQIWVRTDAAWD